HPKPSLVLLHTHTSPRAPSDASRLVFGSWRHKPLRDIMSLVDLKSASISDLESALDVARDQQELEWLGLELHARLVRHQDDDTLRRAFAKAAYLVPVLR